MPIASLSTRYYSPNTFAKAIIVLIRLWTIDFDTGFSLLDQSSSGATYHILQQNTFRIHVNYQQTYDYVIKTASN